MPENPNSQKPSQKQNWYSKGNTYWQKSKQTYDGVMSGYGKYSNIDIASSKKFIEKIKLKYPISMRTVLDCGAGIGRVTIQLLQSYFSTIDLVDQSQNFIKKARDLLTENPKVRNFYVSGLQDFNFQEKYDCIWVQWVLSQLKNSDAVDFLKKCKQSLNENGMLIVKENESGYTTEEDQEDCSYIRTQRLHKKLFQAAGLRVLQEQADKDWPSDLYRTKMYALI